MMVCTSICGVVDGVFVSNFVGSDAFAAVNLIMPFLMVLGAVGFMLGTGAVRWWRTPWEPTTKSVPTRSSPC